MSNNISKGNIIFVRNGLEYDINLSIYLKILDNRTQQNYAFTIKCTKIDEHYNWFVTITDEFELNTDSLKNIISNPRLLFDIFYMLCHDNTNIYTDYNKSKINIIFPKYESGSLPLEILVETHGLNKEIQYIKLEPIPILETVRLNLKITDLQNKLLDLEQQVSIIRKKTKKTKKNKKHIKLNNTKSTIKSNNVLNFDKINKVTK
ncbi:hypothetical protein QLL95_gp0613 [Cotonvirus japonicus]|uniref:Uncharacterized protein n=1 Tax=Cotonvirus japonicus TaxID=2811091 RepID=A0ABM7NTK6_9VIRU|nr:hypothetical protein QLL95_gp0613 [Cotonvirus japonicus]BCS83510.1 hypothetical protein [Cotonvirus japonicus]